MDQKGKTSFIPKTKISKKSSGSSTDFVSIVFIISLFLLFLVASLFGGVLIYNNYLTKRIEQKKGYLEDSKEAFDPTLINELKTLDNRIKFAGEILNNHETPLIIFKMLQEKTLETISFNNFSYKSEEDNSYTISMRGSAKNFNSLALQSKIFGNMDFFKNVVFSSLGIGEGGRISFNFDSELNPRDMLFKKVVSKNYFSENENQNNSKSNGEDVISFEEDLIK